MSFSVLSGVKVCRAQHVADTNHELASVLYTRREKDMMEDSGNKEGTVEKRKKQGRMQAIRNQLGTESSPLIMVGSLTQSITLYCYLITTMYVYS